MALTKVAPALFGTGNNITSVTVGGSANTISLTFDASGVITSATNNAISVANTLITGNIISSQITSVANTQITGNITAAQITSVANTQLTGLIQAAQIGSANATLVTSGTLPKTRLPTGSVLQVVNSNYSTQVTNSTQTDADSGLTATITPLSATSNILCIVNMAGLYNNSGNSVGIQLRIIRNSTFIIQFARYTNYIGSAVALFSQAGANHLDSPATTSATTYKVVFCKSDSTGGTVSVQQNGDTSTMTLMEIAA